MHVVPTGMQHADGTMMRAVHVDFNAHGITLSLAPMSHYHRSVLNTVGMKQLNVTN